MRNTELALSISVSAGDIKAVLPGYPLLILRAGCPFRYNLMHLKRELPSMQISFIKSSGRKILSESPILHRLEGPAGPTAG
jgi:hypothetical protein